MPDRLDVHGVRDGRLLQTFTLGAEADDDPSDVVGPRARTRALADGTVGMADLFYSLGRANPGALTLHNYPDWMRHLRRRKSDGDVDEIIDLAAIDIVRDRERGVLATTASGSSSTCPGSSPSSSSRAIRSGRASSGRSTDTSIAWT
jgi:hypothetical protein